MNLPWHYKQDFTSNEKETGKSSCRLFDSQQNLIGIIPDTRVAEFIVNQASLIEELSGKLEAITDNASIVSNDIL